MDHHFTLLKYFYSQNGKVLVKCRFSYLLKRRMLDTCCHLEFVISQRKLKNQKGNEKRRACRIFSISINYDEC
jgi:hypothetical protein